MIRVKIELCPHGDETKAEEIGRMYVANIGGTAQRGWYDVAVCKRGSKAVPYGFAGVDFPGPKPARTGKVNDYPRLSYNVWRLILRALVAAFPEDHSRWVRTSHANRDEHVEGDPPSEVERT